jgi:hypothetical protein
VSLLLISFQVEEVFSSRYFETYRQRYGAHSGPLITEADSVFALMCKQQFVESELAPSNFGSFDDVISDKAIMCEWSSKIKDLIGKVNFKELCPIDMSWFDPPKLKTNFANDAIIELNSDAKDYVQFRDEALELRSHSKPDEFKLTMLAFAPYFFALALAMQLAKVRFKESRS